MKPTSKKLYKFLNKEKTAGVVFCLPFIIGFLLFLIIPMGISFYYSLCDYDILSPPKFVGLKTPLPCHPAAMHLRVWGERLGPAARAPRDPAPLSAGRAARLARLGALRAYGLHGRHLPRRARSNSLRDRLLHERSVDAEPRATFRSVAP